MGQKHRGRTKNKLERREKNIFTLKAGHFGKNKMARARNVVIIITIFFAIYLDYIDEVHGPDAADTFLVLPRLSVSWQTGKVDYFRSRCLLDDNHPRS